MRLLKQARIIPCLIKQITSYPSSGVLASQANQPMAFSVFEIAKVNYYHPVWRLATTKQLKKLLFYYAFFVYD